MELSQYVLDTILLVDSSAKGRHDHLSISIQLKDAAAKAPEQEDSDFLETISGILSMSYVLKEHQFTPFAIWHDGRRSFAFEDLKDSDAVLIEKVADNIQNVSIRAKFYHVAWLLSNNYQHGESAVSEYIALFEEAFDPSDWIDCHEAIQCAFYIASKLGKKTGAMQKTRTAIHQKLVSMDGEDTLFLSLSLLELVIKDATEKELEAYYQLVNKLVLKNICQSNDNTHLADSTFSVQESILKRLKKDGEIKTATLNYANYYESMAESLAKTNDYQRAVIMLKKSCQICSVVDKEKLLALRTKLEALQKKALDSMQGFPFEFDATSTHKAIEQLLAGLSLQETIVQLGRIAKIYNVEDVKKELFEKQKTSFFSSLFSSSMLNEKGQTVQELAPLHDVDDNTNSELVRKHMVRHVSEYRSLLNSVTLGYAFGFLRAFGDFSVDELDFLVLKNAIIPENRTEIIKEGIYLGLTGNLYSSMHILLPQTENIFRNLVSLCGDTTTFLKGDGTEEYKPLSSLFKSGKLHECYDENIIFTFQSIMDDPIGENLRNLNAHGTLEPQIGNSISALYFMCLLIKLLVMYSPEAQPILKKLANQNFEKEI